jgi:hypothetical protein
LENNIKVKEIVWEGVECDHVAQDKEKLRAVTNKILKL